MAFEFEYYSGYNAKGGLIMSRYKVPCISEQKTIYPNLPVDWIIHLVKNGNVCQECGGVEMGLLPNACNAHTHGMERYNHLNFQLVLNYLC